MKFIQQRNLSTTIILLALIYLGGCSKETVEDTFIDVPEATGPWNLIFEDHFEDDLSLWNVWNGGAFNEEIQMYKPEQLLMENGILKIIIQREDVTGPISIFDNTPKGFEYVSGRIESKEVFGPSNLMGELEYRFLARIKLPPGHGMWPAFWTYGDPWPTQGEIDILEARGGELTEYLSNMFYGNNPNININSGTTVVHSIGQNLGEEFHEYEMIWKANSVEIFFDGQLLHTYTANTNNNINNMFEKKQKIVLNTAVGGLFFSDRNSSNYVDSSIMEVDWVKVYKR